MRKEWQCSALLRTERNGCCPVQLLEVCTEENFRGKRDAIFKGEEEKIFSLTQQY